MAKNSRQGHINGEWALEQVIGQISVESCQVSSQCLKFLIDKPKSRVKTNVCLSFLFKVQ